MQLINNPIIVFGTGRCGTTLISEIIFRHRDLAFPSNYHEKVPGCAGIGKVRSIYDNNFWRFFGTKDQGINRVSFLNKVLFTPSEAWSMWDRITKLGDEFSRGFLLGKKADTETTVEIQKYFEKLVSAQARSRLSFKLTGPSRLEYLSGIFPDAIFIHVLRNPVPVISSFLKVPFWQRQGIHQLWWRGAYSDADLNLVNEHKDNPIWMTGFQIKKIIDTTKLEQQKIGANFIEVKYEQFVSEPESFLRSLLERLNLDIDIECFRYLSKQKIFSNKKSDSDYFNTKDLDVLYSIFN